MQAVAEPVSRDLVLQSLSALVSALSPDARLTVLSLHDTTLEVIASLGESPLDDGAMLVSSTVRVMHARLASEGPFFVDSAAPGLPPYGRDILRLMDSRAAFIASLYSADGVMELVVVDQPGERLDLDDREYQLLCAAVSQAGMAVANYDARILAARQELETTKFLLSTAGVLAQRRTLSEVLDALVDSLLAAIGHSRASVSLYDEASGLLTMASSRGVSPVPVGTALPLATASNAVRTAVLERRSVIADYDSVDQPSEHSAKFKAHLAFVLPIVYADQLVGLIAVDDPDERRLFTSRQTVIIEGLAAQAAIAIENARLFEAQQVELARTMLLKEIAAIGASSLTVKGLAEPGLETIRVLLGASTGNLFIIDETRGVLHSVASFGVPDEVLAVYGEIPFDDTTANGRVALTGQLVTHDGDVPGPTEHMVEVVGLKELRWVFLPVKTREKILGTLGLAFEECRGFTPEEISLLESVASQFGVAIGKAQLFEGEQQRSRRLVALGKIAELGGSLLETRELAGRLADAIAEVMGADRALVALVDAESETLVPAGSHGWPEEYLAEMTPVPVTSPVSLAYSSGNMQLLEDARGDDVDSLTRARSERFGMTSIASLPLLVAGEPVGTLSIAWAERHWFDADETGFLESVAAAAAVGLQNAQLFESTSRRAELEATLVDATAVLASSRDIREAMPGVLASASEALGALSAMLVLREDGGWRVAAVHDQPDELIGEFHSDDAAPTLAQVRRTRKPMFVPDVQQADKIVAEQASRLGHRSFITHPILYRDEVMAALSFMFERPRAGLRVGELHFVSRLAFMIGVTEENARLYQAEHRIAETLQSALLAMPEPLPGVEFAHAYHSATEATRVGGDFYDIFELSESHVGITIGDVAGKGLEAAALTSLVKNTVRAHAAERGRSPREVLGLTNRVVYRSTPAESFVTVFFGVLDRRDGSMVYASAGHTTSAIINHQGEVTPLRSTGPLLGAFDDVEFDQAEVALDGRMLFLYTDGLTEARYGNEFYGEGRLFDFLGASEWSSPEEVVSEVVADVVFFSHEQMRDDMAILVVACAGDPLDTPQQQKLEV